MATLFIFPSDPTSSFPGGIAGGFPRDVDTHRSTTQFVPVGTKAIDKDGNEYTCLKAGATIAINDWVRPNADLSDVRSVSATQQNMLGVATAAFAVNEFGWVLSRGRVTAKVVAATAANSLLVSTATAGTAGLAAATDLAGAHGAVQLSAEAGGLATCYLN